MLYTWYFTYSVFEEAIAQTCSAIFHSYLLNLKAKESLLMVQNPLLGLYMWQDHLALKVPQQT